MDSEEFEQIPWSALVAEQNDGVDKRIYLAVGVVGVLIAVVFGTRLLGGSGGQPTPIVAPAPVGEVAVPPETTSTTGVVVSEADLMAGAPDVLPLEGGLEITAFAEWFVTDYFTTDGSPETARSLRALLAPGSDVFTLPHEADPAPAVVYVEWARALRVRFVGADDVEVDVAFRTITDEGEGFARDPVRAVTVTLLLTAGSSGITGPPIVIPVPPLGS